MISFVVAALCAFGLSQAGKVRYDGHSVIRVVPDTPEQASLLDRLQRDLEAKHIDLWHQTAGPGSPLDIRVSPDDFPDLFEAIEVLGMSPSIMIPDVQAYADAQLPSVTSDVDPFDYAKYHTLEEIMAWIENMTTTFPMQTTMISIAKSFEGRPLSGIKISGNSLAGKPAMWFEGGIHAREWISPATVLYMTNQLLTQYGHNQEVTDLMNMFDIYIVPVVNVDGYKYTWTTDRLWRKTRSTHSGTKCVGVDPNRNWDIDWCDLKGASDDPCSEIYCGPSPFSENVVKGVSDFISKTGGFVGFIDFHSYSQLWMTPYGFKKALPKDFPMQEKSSKAAVTALEAVFGTKYQFGTIANVIYIATGSSADWTYVKAGIKYSVGVELRDRGKYGFLLPADQIVPSGEETFQGLLAFMKFVKNNP